MRDRDAGGLTTFDPPAWSTPTPQALTRRGRLWEIGTRSTASCVFPTTTEKKLSKEPNVSSNIKKGIVLAGKCFDRRLWDSRR